MAVLVLKDGFTTAMTSLQVAELTGKRHDNVMLDIKDESIKLGEEISLLIFQESEYKNTRGKVYKMYNLNRDGVLQLGARYDAKTRYKMVQRINELEKAVQHQFKIPQTYKEALMLAVEQQEIIEQQEEKIEILTHTDNTYTATELANEIGMKSAQKFNVWLQDCGFQRRVNGTWVPYAKFSEEGYVEIKQEIVKTKEVYHRKFTQKGREYILDLAKDCSGKRKVC